MSKVNNTSPVQDYRIRRTVIWLTLASILVFGFGYALVPIYDVFCEITGINGKTGVISQTDAQQTMVDGTRQVTVEFDTNVHGGLPWGFSAVNFSLQVYPGELSEAVFVAENHSNRAISGQAIPSVAPQTASLYFNKTECFCFQRQELAPGERREMRVRFIVDKDLPEKIETLTLSYAFFPFPQNDSG